MSDLRIVDAPEIPTEEITGSEKLPTGGNGNYSISLDSIANHTKTSLDLANKTDVQTSSNGVKSQLDQHKNDLNNPHQVTKDQVGLGNVDNTADADKPMSNAVQSAITTLTNNKADKTSVYLKTETYNKTEIDSALATKPNSTTVYTKAEVNDLLNGKVASVNGKTGTAITLNRSDLGISSDIVMQQWEKEAQYVIDESGLTQQNINGGLESIAELLAIPNPKNGNKQNVNSYHAGIGKGGDYFTYDSTLASTNNGVTIFNGWKRRNKGFLLASDAGCREGSSFDNTDELNALMLVASESGVKQCILDGFYEIGKLEVGITTTPFGDENAWWLLKCRSNVTLSGRSWGDGIKLKGGLVDSNKNEPNTKGYMIFGDYNQFTVENFTIENFRVDNNGQQNLMPQVEGFGSQALCPNVWFQRGINIKVKNVNFIDNAGHQTIVFDSGVKNGYIQNCQFTNNGKGLVNNNYIVDHSTVYVRATNFWVTDNLFLFTTLKPDISTALEIHGVNGHVYGNTTKGYPFPLIRASFFGQNSNNVKVHDNTFNDVNYGINLDGADASPLHVEVYDNVFNFRPERPSDGHPQVAIGHTADGGFSAVSPSSTHDIVVNVHNNEFNQPDITGGWTKFNEFDNCIWDGGKCTKVTIVNNTFIGFRGGYRINFANSRAEYVFDDTLNNCGSPNTDVKSLVIIQNINLAWTGQVKSIVNKSNLNNFNYEHLIYFNDEKPPLTGLFENTCNKWILPYSGSSPDNSLYFRFEYSVDSVDANHILYAQGVNVVGKITLPNDQYFYKQIGYTGRWNMHRTSPVSPTSPRFFGDIKGDRVDILSPNSGEYASFICTVSGVDVNTVGVWKGFGMIQA